jgi:hypothetical protein
MATSNLRSLLPLAVASASFVGFVIAIFILAARHIVTVQMALLMFVGLVGLYVGFGALILVYRFVAKLK